MKNLILASASIRRKELLKMIGLPFEVVNSNFREYLDPSKNPHQLACELSLGKAKAVAKKFKKAIIIGVDTFVVCNGEFLGKAHNKKEAQAMLKKLSGKSHKVVSGVTVIDTEANKIITKSVETKVYFKKLTSKEIDNYVDSGEPLEKAGAYAIQGLASMFVRKIEGDYFNIVGLPIFTLVKILKLFGLDPLKSYNNL